MDELIQARAAAAAELARIEAQLAEHAAAARNEAIAKVKALMSETGITLGDLGAIAPKLSIVKAAKAPAAPMYRNAHGLTWAGKGKRPNWLRAELGRGATLESFKIAA